MNERVQQLYVFVLCAVSFIQIHENIATEYVPDRLLVCCSDVNLPFSLVQCICSNNINNTHMNFVYVYFILILLFN